MKLATIEKVESVIKHPNADSLSITKVAGYECITKLDQYKVGDFVVLIQPDTVLPDKPWAKFYKEKSNRVKAIRLRGSWSFGIVESLDILKDEKNAAKHFKEGDDVTEVLGVVKYVSPATALADAIEQEKTFGEKIKNPFLRKMYWLTIGKIEKKFKKKTIDGFSVYGIPKTDEDRWQSIEKHIPFGETVDVTEKIEGQSCSFFIHRKAVPFLHWFVRYTYTYGVLGRSVTHRISKVHSNDYVKNWFNYDIQNKLRAYCDKHNVNLCIRGESFGGKIQNFAINPRAGKPLGWMMFSVYLIDEKRYARKGDKHYFLNVAREMNLPHVPVLEENVELTPALIKKYDTDLTELNGHTFEGVVIQHKNDSFKVINKTYDSKK